MDQIEENLWLLFLRNWLKFHFIRSFCEMFSYYFIFKMPGWFVFPLISKESLTTKWLWINRADLYSICQNPHLLIAADVVKRVKAMFSRASIIG